MNFLTIREHDKFSGTTTTSTSSFWNSYTIFVFKHTSNQEGEHIFLEVSNRRHDGYMYLDQGELIFSINNAKNIKLKPSDYYTKKEGFSSFWDIATYELSKEQLLLISNADTITYKLSGDHNSQEGADTDFKLRGDVLIDGKQYHLTYLHSKIQYGSQALYNAVYDSSAFIQELQQVKNAILQREKDYEEAKIKEEAKKQEEIKKNRVKSFFMVFFGIILLLGGLVLVGWGLEACEPVGLLGFLAGAIGVGLFVWAGCLKTK